MCPEQCLVLVQALCEAQLQLHCLVQGLMATMSICRTVLEVPWRIMCVHTLQQRVLDAPVVQFPKCRQQILHCLHGIMGSVSYM